MADSTPQETDSQINKAISHLTSLLVPNERLEAYAVQRRIFALFRRRSLVAATTGRFIGINRGLLGGFSPDDVRWQDLKELRIHVGVFGADLTIVALTSPDLAISGSLRTLHFPGLRKEEAQAVYRFSQAQEQAWREKRRIRELEELRAKSGGVQFGTSGSGSVASSSADTGDPTARLQRAKEMLDKGLINDSEYESLKARIIGAL